MQAFALLREELTHQRAVNSDLLAALEDALEQLEAYSGVVAHAYSDRPDLCTEYLDVTQRAASSIYKAKGITE